MKNPYIGKYNPVANPKAILQGENYRFTLLSDCLIRMEYSESGKFVNLATQTILNRNFPVPEFEVNETEDELKITTRFLQVQYDKKHFSSYGLSIQMFYNPCLRKLGTWVFGDEEMLAGGNLKGTMTTLDNAVGDVYYGDSIDASKLWGEPVGKVDLGRGLISSSGFTVIDDSHSVRLLEDGWYEPAEQDGYMDFYFMVYGRDFLGGLKQFYAMSGSTPMLPRYVLGNWWSRFYRYTQSEYKELMNRFEEEKIPISVSVLDMDWHLVDIDTKYGRGWTGYTWNRELFPEPEKLLGELHDMGKHVTLNVHPADGIRAHEEAYPEMTKAMGIDSTKEYPVPFDSTNRTFMEAYFKYLHHPLEEQGVDFWWIDWQQGSNSKMPGCDPLWALNHYHYLDSGRDGKRPLTFSRYAGLGSHRYPIGFSGSSFITWESLDFQPYLTATASNVGYGWWSHDIGGHRNGYRDDDLTARWVEFGCFSPIMRIHSSDETFTGREPWKFCADTERVMRRHLSLRHQLVPYLYTMNERCYSKNEPLIQPMYYHHPENPDAFTVPNEYYFGSELIVSPITSPQDRDIKAGAVSTLLPEGTWFDIFTGLHYDGGRRMMMYRSIDSIPVLAKAGGIVPLQAKEELSNHTNNPESFEILIFPGKDGNFSLYEDDGESLEYEKGHLVTTGFTLTWGEKKSFVIEPAEGDLSLIPEKRNYKLKFYGIANDAIVAMGNSEVTYDAEKQICTVILKDILSVSGVSVEIHPETDILPNAVLAISYEVLNRAQIAFSVKEKLYAQLKNGLPVTTILTNLNAMAVPDVFKLEMIEILTATC